MWIKKENSTVNLDNVLEIGWNGRSIYFCRNEDATVRWIYNTVAEAEAMYNTISGLIAETFDY